MGTRHPWLVEWWGGRSVREWGWGAAWDVTLPHERGVRSVGGRQRGRGQGTGRNNLKCKRKHNYNVISSLSLSLCVSLSSLSLFPSPLSFTILPLTHFCFISQICYITNSNLFTSCTSKVGHPTTPTTTTWKHTHKSIPYTHHSTLCPHMHTHQRMHAILHIAYSSRKHGAMYRYMVNSMATLHVSTLGGDVPVHVHATFPFLALRA